MHITIKLGGDPHGRGIRSYVNLVGGNNEIVWTSQGHAKFYARRKAHKLGKTMGIDVLDFTVSGSDPKVTHYTA